MHKRTLAALLMSTTLLGGGALAQTTAPSTTPTPATTAAPAAAAPSGNSAFVTDQATTEFRASKFVGLDVYGTENEKIGDIAEILLDGQGNAKAVVIGVGGFLGIGQKNVAVPWSALTWVNDKPATRTSAAPSSGAPVGGGSPMATGSTGTPPAAATPARSPAEQAAYNGYPDHATVQLTKAQLQDAPGFKYYSDSHSSSGATSPAGGTARP